MVFTDAKTTHWSKVMMFYFERILKMKYLRLSVCKIKMNTYVHFKEVNYGYVHIVLIQLFMIIDLYIENVTAYLLILKNKVSSHY